MKFKLIFLIILSPVWSTLSTVVIIQTNAPPRDLYVDESRPDDSGFGMTWANAKKTIQAAVDVAFDGDTIWVTNGTYFLSAEISVTKAIMIRSVNGPDVTIVDGCLSNRCFNLHGSACVIAGFTITHGGAWDKSGGGVYCDGITPVVSNCLFFANEAGCIYTSFGWSGGGLFKGTAINCVFDSNGAMFGGGVYGGRAYGCVFTNNYGAGGSQWGNSYGAGMSHGEAYNCLFVGNTGCFNGAGLYEGAAFNCTFVGNWSQFEGSAFAGGTAYNCIFSGNISDTGYSEIFDSEIYYSCSLELTNGVNGNITNPPLFVDTANGKFQLQSNSPCINWGNNSYVTNTTDLDGNPRIVEGTVDMGAYEYQGTVGLADSDFDSIPDDWERQHGGNQKSDRICSNGVNSVLQAYVAGLDPNDPDSRFNSELLPGNVLRWNATSGRVYAVYYATNLISGFQPLETNIPWAAGCFTDTVHNADGQLFYKLDVRLDN